MLRDQITEHKTEILQFLRSASAVSRFSPPPINRVAKDQASPLSFAQERLWFLEQLEPGSSVYNVCRAARLAGLLNVGVLESSLTEIVRRHEVLRTTFQVVDGRPVQITARLQRFLIPLIELQRFSNAERDGEVGRLIAEEARRPFNLCAGPLLRATLLRLNHDDHILILTTHHIISDAWSMGILTRELWTLYEAYAKGKASPLKDLPVQYADYAVWQREWLQREVLESQLSYWKEQLKELPILNLPTDHPRPVKQSFRGARQRISLPESLTAAVNELNRREGVTQFMTLLTAFCVLLYRYSGQEDLVVGSPIANRSRTELEGLIGFFVNTLVLRTDLSENPTFRQLLSRVRDVCLSAYAHQDLPFEKLVQDLQPERDLSRNPLFQVMFVLQNATRPFGDVRGLRIEPVETENTRSQFDLSLFLREREGRYVGYFQHSTDLFDASTIERMAGHFEALLKGIVVDCYQPLSALPLLSDAERQQLLIEWNDTDAEYPNSCIHELFEAQVERTPDAVAVKSEDKQLTYRDLNGRANQLAHYLRSLGVGPEKLVGICIERSLEMIVGLLGILKAGGAYVPLDPAYPRERLAFMLEDAQVSVLLTEERLIEDRRSKPVLSPSTKLRIDSAEGIEDSNPPSSILDPQLVCLVRDWYRIAEQSHGNCDSGVTAENLAYVIYTSGSTGTPKGVAIEHRNASNLLHWAKSVFGAPELAGVLASTSICFDLSVFELFVPLCWGGKVILAENALHLHSLPTKNEITLINTVPSVMTELLEMGDLPEGVRTVTLAGEPLRSELVKAVYRRGKVAKVCDLYGPSETTTYSTLTLRDSDGPTTIGRPIANTRIYILDRDLKPMPIGMSGELFIGGAGVARGYLNRPTLTAERFISSSFSIKTGERLYRTGDLARYRPDGNIEFLGRVDNQVKIRGHRIELSEIESVLNQHPAVEEGVVIVREDVTEEAYDPDNRKSKIENLKSNTRLVAYIVPVEQKPTVTELRTFLKKKLPDYMIPSAFVILDALPLTPNGKVDRLKLPRPDSTRTRLTAEFVAPGTEIEELIAQTWREVLKLENLGIHDNFFELGGHSLLAIQIILRLRDAFNREIPLRVLFETPTVAGLAVTVENLIRGGRDPELPPIVPVSHDGPLPLSLNQERLWHLDQMIPGTHFFHMPYVYRISGDVNMEALQRALKEIIQRHETLRTVFTEVDGRPVQIIRPIHDFEVPVVSLGCLALGELEQQAAAMILEERQQSFDLASGPPIRTKLLQLTGSEHILVVTLHHIISDHWSMRVFCTELAMLYGAFSEGKPSPLTEPSIQFADYACWERYWMDSEFVRDHLAYWKEQLVSPLPLLEFQKGCERTKTISFQTSRQPLQLNETLFAGVKARAREENCTPFIVLVSALSIVLHQYTGQSDIRIGTLVANRRRETEGVIGHFLNTVILRMRVCPDMTVRQLLVEVRHLALAAYAHQELPFEQLAKVLEEEQKLERGSLFQVLFNYQRASFESQKICGPTFAPIDLQQSTGALDLEPTTFDLVLKLREMSTTLTGTVNYRADIFSEEFVVGMVERFGKVIKSVVLQGEQLIRSISLDE